MSVIHYNTTKSGLIKAWSLEKWAETIILYAIPQTPFLMDRIMMAICKRELQIEQAIDDPVFAVFFATFNEKDIVSAVTDYMMQRALVVQDQYGEYSLTSRSKDIKELGSLQEYYARQERQARIEESIIATNQSIIETNLSVKELNTRTSDIYRFQKSTTILTIILVIAALLATVASFWVS